MLLSVDGVHTNKAPGGVADRCSFRVTEVAYAIESAMNIMSQKLGMYGIKPLRNATS